MIEKPFVGNLRAQISAIIANGRTGNIRAVIQTLNEVEKEAKNSKDDIEVQELLASAYRHSLEPFGVGKKFKDVEQLILKIEHLLKLYTNSETMEEIYSEALNAAIFHYIMDGQEKEVHRTLTKLGSFANKHQNNPFVQFSYALSLSKVAEYFAQKDNKEVSYNILWEIIGIVTFYPGKEILTQVSDGLLQCINVAGIRLNLDELNNLANRIDEFLNFTNDYDIQQKLTSCQGKIFQFIAGQRIREGLRPDGKAQRIK